VVYCEVLFQTVLVVANERKGMPQLVQPVSRAMFQYNSELLSFEPVLIETSKRTKHLQLQC
jgi:hypothetical protein